MNGSLETARKTIEEGFAAVHVLRLAEISDVTGFGGGDNFTPPALLEVWTGATYGVASLTPEDAIADFLEKAHFPFQSIKSRVTLLWRRVPELVCNADSPHEYRVFSRFVWVLDAPEGLST